MSRYAALVLRRTDLDLKTRALRARLTLHTRPTRVFLLFLPCHCEMRTCFTPLSRLELLVSVMPVSRASFNVVCHALLLLVFCPVVSAPFPCSLSADPLDRFRPVVNFLLLSESLAWIKLLHASIWHDLQRLGGIKSTFTGGRAGWQGNLRSGAGGLLPRVPAQSRLALSASVERKQPWPCGSPAPG